jgi:hypothetical protein
MIPPGIPVEGEPAREPVVRALFSLLLGGYRCAALLGRPARHFPCRWAQLRRTGVEEALVRGLVARGQLEARPPSEADDPHQPWDPRTRLVLTPDGAALAAGLLVQEHPGLDGGGAGGARPSWDPRTREVWFRGRLVKRLRRTAPNQECVLTAFEECGWPRRMDDPLPRGAERLRETVKSLNRGQHWPALRFTVEADGRGLRWVAVEPGLLARELSPQKPPAISPGFPLAARGGRDVG